MAHVCMNDPRRWVAKIEKERERAMSKRMERIRGWSQKEESIESLEKKLKDQLIEEGQAQQRLIAAQESLAQAEELLARRREAAALKVSEEADFWAGLSEAVSQGNLKFRMIQKATPENEARWTRLKKELAGQNVEMSIQAAEYQGSPMRGEWWRQARVRAQELAPLSRVEIQESEPARPIKAARAQGGAKP